MNFRPHLVMTLGGWESRVITIHHTMHIECLFKSWMVNDEEGWMDQELLKHCCDPLCSCPTNLTLVSYIVKVPIMNLTVLNLWEKNHIFVSQTRLSTTELHSVCTSECHWSDACHDFQLCQPLTFRPSFPRSGWKYWSDTLVNIMATVWLAKLKCYSNSSLNQLRDQWTFCLDFQHALFLQTQDTFQRCSFTAELKCSS